MSTVKGVNKTKYDADDTGDNKILSGEFRTDIHCIKELYECAALEDASTIALPDLPIKGAKITDIILFFDDLGTSVTVAIGDVNTADLYMAATSVASAGRLSMNKVDGFNYITGTNDNDNKLLLTTAGITTGTIKALILYTV